MKYWLRKLHRWLGLLMALQIIAWMGSGLYFAWIPIDEIRGEHLTAPAKMLTETQVRDSIKPDKAWAAVKASLAGDAQIRSVRLIRRYDQPHYRIEFSADGRRQVRMVNAVSGVLIPGLGEAEAMQVAIEALAVTSAGASATWIDQSEAGSEYRGRPLPLWRVDFEKPDNLSLYLSPWTGEVLATRTSQWRVFDFLWMLHIMDFDGRDDFNTPLLQVAAMVGLVIALSGVVYWAMTTRLWRRRRSITKGA